MLCYHIVDEYFSNYKSLTTVLERLKWFLRFVKMTRRNEPLYFSYALEQDGGKETTFCMNERRTIGVAKALAICMSIVYLYIYLCEYRFTLIFWTHIFHSIELR